MFLKKHYEIPFLKESALLFCLLHKILTERDKLYKVYRALPFIELNTPQTA